MDVMKTPHIDPSRIAAARNQAGLSRAELGRRIGKNDAYLGDIERGKRGCGVDLAVLLAEALKVEAGSFYRLISPDDLVADDNERGLLTLYRQLGSFEKGQVTMAARLLLEWQPSIGASTGAPASQAESPLAAALDGALRQGKRQRARRTGA